MNTKLVKLSVVAMALSLAMAIKFENNDTSLAETASFDKKDGLGFV